MSHSFSFAENEFHALDSQGDVGSGVVFGHLFVALFRFDSLGHHGIVGHEEQRKLAHIVVNHRGALLLDVLGVGTQIAARFLTTIGDIERFDSPRSAVAYVGLAPKNNITGHINKPKPRKSGLPDTRYKGQGRVSKHGDTYLRTLLTQGAASIYMLHSRKALEQCPLKCWLEKQLNNGKPYGKIIISLAAKLVRIMWALLTYGEEFVLHKREFPTFSTLSLQ